MSPLIVGIGGTMRPDSSSERALRITLHAARAAGARTEIVCGPSLVLPPYDPSDASRSAAAIRLVTLLRECDGVIVSSPGYHGSISGLIKNALDYIEDMRDDDRPYLEGRAVGCLVCAHGWQATGSTLTALRSVAHALRAWPAPLGVTINSGMNIFHADGECADVAVANQLDTVARQVVDFANQLRTAQKTRHESASVSG